MSFKKVFSYFLFFSFLILIFFPSSHVFSNGRNCNDADYCTLGGWDGEHGVCNTSGTTYCECGTSLASCDRPAQDKVCRGVYGNSQNTNCFPGETCNCTAPAPIPGCMNPLADNYNPYATQDDGSCVITQPGFQNLNFWVKDQNNAARQGALVTIGQNFGNGTTRNTDGAGFANFGVLQNNTVNYTVSATNCNTSSGSRYVGTADETVNVGLNCTDPGSNPPPPPTPLKPAIGTVESYDCNQIVGGAADPDDYTKSIGVYLFSGNTFQLGGTYQMDVMASIPRPDININYAIPGDHGFVFTVPNSLKDGVARTFYVHPRDLGDTGPFNPLDVGTLNSGVKSFVLQCAPPTTTPTIDNVSISSPMVTPNGATQYTVQISGSDVGGGSKIAYEYALINLAGANAGQYRGWMAWSSAYAFPGEKNTRGCAGGGNGAIRSGGAYDAYGPNYINLISCSTVVGGNSRVTTFTITLDPSFTSPLINNDIVGTVLNSDGNWNSNSDAGIWPWKNFDINFGLNMPSLGSITISPSPVTADGSTQHTISVVGTDPTSGTNIDQQYAWINQTSGNDRGWLVWATNNDPSWSTFKNLRTCTGGGWAAIQNADPSYGSSYVDIVPGPTGCVTSTSGNTRTTTFRVTFNPAFTTPTSGNTIYGVLRNTFGHWAPWTPGVLFNLNVPIAGTCGNANGRVYTSGVTTYSPDVQCSAGTSNNTAFPGVGSSVNWTCVGANGGANSPVCSASRATPVVNGSCGTANTTYGSGVTTYGSDTFCSAGTASPASPAFPAQGSSTNWSCVGSGTGHTDASCTATRSAVGTYNLSVTATSSLGGSVTSSPAGINCGGTCTAPFSSNSSVTLTAVPKSSFWRFRDWGGDCSGTLNTCSVLVNGNKSVIANFVPRSFIYKEF